MAVRRYVLQFTTGGAVRTFLQDWWALYAAAYVTVFTVHFVITTRDG